MKTRMLLTCFLVMAVFYTATMTLWGTTPPQGVFTMAQTISDGAQRTTLAFDGLAMMSGNLDAQSFFPPGKVADYTGFQYLRDNDPDNMGHNTSFLTRIANNVIYMLNADQLSQLQTLAVSQQSQYSLYGYKRFSLMQAFRRLIDGNFPSGSSGLSLSAVKQASHDLYLIDGQISFDRAVLYAKILNSLNSAQIAYLDAMKGQGWNSWPDITDSQIQSKMKQLPQGTAVLVMSYASDLFSWYAGSLDADIYFCPERHGTYYGGFYIKDAPAVGHEGYSISEQLTATAGAALCDSMQGYVTAAQAQAISSLVDTQRNNLYAGTTTIVGMRTQIATLLRSLLTSTTSSDSVKTQVLALSGTYGDLDGENNYNYATVFAQVYQSMSAAQKTKLSTLRKSIMSGTYADGTAFDFTNCTTPFLYSEIITNLTLLDPYIANTDYLFAIGTPSISAIAKQIISLGTATSALPFTVRGVTSVSVLTLAAASSNTTLVPTANIVFGGSGAARTVTVSPAAGIIGTASITLTVTDGGGLQASTSFMLTVYGQPSISNIANRCINQGWPCTNALAFTVGDGVDAAATLTVTGVSSNVALVPSANITLGGAGAERTVKLALLTGMSGVTTITLTVSNGGGQTATSSFTLSVYGIPTITSIANQLIPVGATPAALNFTVNDSVTSAASLTVTGISSNQSLVPTANITFAGSGALRAVTISPLAGVCGITTIKLTVTNSAGRTSYTSFTYRVYPPPTITGITNKIINLGTPATSALGFTVSDSVTPAAVLTVSGTSSNQSLVPNANVILGGTGAARTVKLTPIPGISDVTTISLTVTDDGGLSATTSFTLTVNGPPTISQIANQTILVNTSTFALAFSIGDDVTNTGALKVTGVSSFSSVIPTANIVISGTGAARTVTVTPVVGKSGTATITLTVRDAGGLAATMSFKVTVH